MSCDTFYIVTSPSSPCPGEYIGVPCLTLQQYASNPSRSQNITFLVEPGAYNLSTVLTVSNGYNFTMSSVNATVTCTSTTARFEFDTVENVYISGMTFRGCRSTAVRMTTVSNAAIMSSTFINNHATGIGGCLYVTFSWISIFGSEFLSNSAYDRGGAIYATSSTIIISQSTFTQNTGRYGGVIYVSSSPVVINGSVFIHNTASRYNSDGGVIYAQHSNITVYASEFSNNFAYDTGGAIYTYNSVRNRNVNFLTSD